MTRIAFALVACAAVAAPLLAQDVDTLAGKRMVVLGDSNTQAGGYVSFMSYYLNKLHIEKSFDVIGLGLASETLSGLSEDGHAGGKFPRPCLFERLGRVLEKAKPEVVFACYGINDGIYLPLDKDRFGRVDEARRVHAGEDGRASTARHRRGRRGQAPRADRRPPAEEVTGHSWPP
jgi:lysophospholipase L1-like esterase